MSSSLPEQPVLHRKLNPLRTAPLGEASGAAHWREVLPKVSQRHLDLPLAVLSVRETRLDPDTFVASLSEFDLCITLKGGPGWQGVAAVDAGAVNALVEIQTLGHVQSVAFDPRPPSAIDAALISEAINLWIGAVLDGGAERESVQRFADFQTGAHLPSPRAARLALDDAPLSVLTLSLDFGEGARQGNVILALPAASQTGDGEGTTRAPASMAARVQLRTELARIELPFQTVAGFEIGAIVELPADALANVRVRGADGGLVGTARLGRAGGFRALCLHSGRPERALANDAPRAPDFSDAVAATGADRGADLENTLGLVPGEPLEEVATSSAATESDGRAPLSGSPAA